MCLAIPAKVMEITGDSAKVDYGGIIKEINHSLVDNVRVDDFLLIHAGFAIEKLDKKAAEDALEIIMNDVNQFNKEDFALKDNAVLEQLTK